MTLKIDNPETDRLARELAEVTGEPIEEAVANALRDQLARKTEIARKLDAIRRIQERVAALPILDSRSDDEILGYDEYGVPT